MSELFSAGIGYSGINTAKSAISSIVNVISNKDIGNHVLVTRFMKGIFNKKPSLPRYNVTWNVALVLKHLSSVDNNSCSLRNLSKKLVMLLALTTGQRCQTLLAIDIRNVDLEDDCVKIRIGNLLKQSSPSNHFHEIFIESFTSNLSLCVVKCLKSYLCKTLELRSGSSVFISTIKPYKPASRSTVANWIRETLRESGINMDLFKPHSTRSAATSAAAIKVPVDTIIRTAGWKSECMFRKHYKRPVTNDSVFSNTVLSHLK